MTNILFVTSEAHPLVKTGGLGDVSGSLPVELQRLGHQVRLLLPAYRSVLDRVGPVQAVAGMPLVGAPESVRILEGRLPGSELPVWLVDSPRHFDRDGQPYTAPDGGDWPDNAQRFAVFARAAVEMAMGRGGLDWRADVVHCNDWQSGLVPALLAREVDRPASLFTVHNLAYQGLFAWSTFESLNLPGDLWSPDAMEFYGNFSFIKGGLVFADYVTTVSPTYADEIRTPRYGYGLEGLLSHRGERLVGILNGIDYADWDPSSDKHLPGHYSVGDLSGKAADKAAVQERFGLAVDPSLPLIGLVGRMVEQKGFDLVANALSELMQRRCQVAILGTGERHFEAAFKRAAEQHPGRIGAHIGFSEPLAHLVEAGSDMFLMPSRFEPCGLNQIYSLRYGTPPVVRRTGGLADTVVDADAAALEQGRATGFVFDEADVAALLRAVDRALELFPQSERWQALMRTGMAQDFSWERSARQYLDLYERAIGDIGRR